MPKEDPQKAESFYANEVYAQGFTTEFPADTELSKLLESNFLGTEKDYSHYIRILERCGLKAGASILDFGSSWGYGSWQMQRAGFNVYSYEIGRERNRYAREKLSCNMVQDLRELDGKIDCFFSAHVIEHLPNPRTMFDEADRVLRPGGLFVCSCPNGATAREGKDPVGYHKNWNQVHPLMLTPEFMLGEAKRRGLQNCVALSSPVNLDDVSDRKSGSLDGSDLLMIAETKCAIA